MIASAGDGLLGTPQVGAGELVEEDSTEGIGDFESSGAEVRDLFADSDEDELAQDSVISEEEEP